MKRLWLIQAVGNALLFWCAFTWLGIRDSKTWQLVETAAARAADPSSVVVAAGWHMSPIARTGRRVCGPPFAEAPEDARDLLGRGDRFRAALLGAGKLEGPLTTAGQRTASWLTFHLRKPIKPQPGRGAIWRCFGACDGLCCPADPAGRGGSRKEWSPWHVANRSRRVFWLEYLLALLTATHSRVCWCTGSRK